MENRKPFELRRVLIVYNFLQVLFSSWLFYEASSTGWLAGYSYRCQPVDYSRTPLAMRVSVKHFPNISICKCLLQRLFAVFLADLRRLSSFSCLFACPLQQAENTSAVNFSNKMYSKNNKIWWNMNSPRGFNNYAIRLNRNKNTVLSTAQEISISPPFRICNKSLQLLAFFILFSYGNDHVRVCIWGDCIFLSKSCERWAEVLPYDRYVWSAHSMEYSHIFKISSLMIAAFHIVNNILEVLQIFIVAIAVASAFYYLFSSTFAQWSHRLYRFVTMPFTAF